VKHGESIRLFDELSLHTGFSRQEIREELDKKEQIIGWLSKFNVRDVIDVGKIIAQFYRDPDIVMAAVRRNEKPRLEKEIAAEAAQPQGQAMTQEQAMAQQQAQAAEAGGQGQAAAPQQTQGASKGDANT